METISFVAGTAIGTLVPLLLLVLMRRARARHTEATPSAPAPPIDHTAADDIPDEVQSPAAAEVPRDRLYRLKREIEGQDERIQRPQDLLALAAFQEGVALLAEPEFTLSELQAYLHSEGYVLGCMAAASLRRRNDVDAVQVATRAAQLGWYILYVLMDFLQAQPDATALPHLLRHARPWWWNHPPLRERLQGYLRWAAQHRPETFGDTLGELDPAALDELRGALQRFNEPVLIPLLDEIAAEMARRRELRVLGGFGRTADLAPAIVPVRTASLDRQLDELAERLLRTPPRSVLVAGEHGVGKTVLIDLLTQRLRADGWLVFEASAADVLSGQSYIGELEGRIGEMLAVLRRPRALWRVPDFMDLLNKGVTRQDPRGILDLVMPAIERGELLVVGEILPRALAELLVARPAVRHRLDVLAVEAPAQPVLQAIIRQWADDAAASIGRPVADAQCVTEAANLAAQYFPDQHEPGRTLRLLQQAAQHALRQAPPLLPLDRDSLLASLAAGSGLPLDVLDDRRGLDLARLRRFFGERVLGQDEAVDCLVDRIAMLKAGLVDPGRPIGVFLFAGPTGTGKTELAKALGELLFGSADRLLRLDMSEYQSEDAYWRLIADGGDAGNVRSLVSRIREQPFSVVLLDEFEKAHPKVWDLFLQVFDDGRLTDRAGNGADFRHAIIILTSNAGATLSRNAGPGFTSTAGGYSRAAVETALFNIFRREFLNRLDRIVPFKPLDRALMRDILHKELGRVLTRRGFRNRAWAVEWEPSAVEFLLDRGFTPDLGARPLRRAIEQHLLAPLARTIVEQRAPEGDQFLFVRSAGDRLEVEFIDPYATTTVPADALEGTASDLHAALRALVYQPATEPERLQALRRALAGSQQALASNTWQAAREADFATMAGHDFWNSPERFEVLDRIERRDRAESACAGAARMAEKLDAAGGSAEFVASLAQLLWLLDLAIDDVIQLRPQDAVLEIGAGDAELRKDPAEVRLWWQRLLRMYLQWAQRRNLQVDVLRQDAAGCRATLAIAGFGAYRLLSRESGLHVLEIEQDGEAARRVPLSVRVRANVPGHARRDGGADAAADDVQRVCRRYRERPSPLVRDTQAGWRSGRLDRVLAGEFDVIT